VGWDASDQPCRAANYTGFAQGEYRSNRPVRQSRNHGRKAVNPYSNIAGSGPASARHFAPQFQRKGAL
jgi:hypothetical protein